jgi:hypothetical protein
LGPGCSKWFKAIACRKICCLDRGVARRRGCLHCTALRGTFPPGHRPECHVLLLELAHDDCLRHRAHRMPSAIRISLPSAVSSNRSSARARPGGARNGYGVPMRRPSRVEFAPQAYGGAGANAALRATSLGGQLFNAGPSILRRRLTPQQLGLFCRSCYRIRPSAPIEGSSATGQRATEWAADELGRPPCLTAVVRGLYSTGSSAIVAPALSGWRPSRRTS